MDSNHEGMMTRMSASGVFTRDIELIANAHYLVEAACFSVAHGSLHPPTDSIKTAASGGTHRLMIPQMG
uniref:Uncharacterized protein n=1 Tax=Caenorhabditis japonica TaxID=281687 RepID=A0A8R1IAC7_CAEJA